MPDAAARDAIRRPGRRPPRSFGCAGLCHLPGRSRSICCWARRFPVRISSLRERYHVGKERTEPPLELLTRVDQVMRRRFEVWPPRQSPRDPRQRAADAFDVLIRKDPRRDVEKHAIEAERARLIAHQREDAIDESLQRLVA